MLKQYIFRGEVHFALLIICCHQINTCIKKQIGRKKLDYYVFIL